MVLKLYGFVHSTCTKRVALVLHEKEVPFEFHPVDITKGEQKAPEILAKQPFGQVPFIDDGGFILYESRAIGRYIAEKYPNQGTKLIPSDIKKRALFEQAASIETANFDYYAAPAVFEAVIKKRRGLTPDENRAKSLMTSLTEKLDGYEKILAKQAYLGGDDITLADLFHLPYGVMLPGTGFNPIAEKESVKKWFDKLEQRPSWQAVKDGVKSTA